MTGWSLDDHCCEKHCNDHFNIHCYKCKLYWATSTPKGNTP